MSAHPETVGSADRQAAREYEELVNNLDDIVFRLDERARWLFLSPAWQTRLGWPVENCIGQPAARVLHASDRRDVIRTWAAIISGQKESYRGELRVRDVAGNYRWMLASARGLRDDAGKLRGVTGTMTDVSTAKAVEAELIAARAAAEVANKAKSEFLATMSHELRTPLNAVIGLSESLLELGPPFDPERTKRYLTIVLQSGRQLLAQINDILDLARIEAGRIQISAGLFDLGALCAAAIEMTQREVRAKQLVTELHRPPAPLFVNADERLLRQVIHNLVSNAVKFTPKEGRIELTVARLPAGGVSVAVRDTGIGIAREKIPLLFKPFSQLDSSLARQFGGTGLGLALVERLVRMHGGSVAVESAPGAGSTFTVELPASVVVVERERPTDRPPRPRSVVIVDDDPHQHTLVGDYLRRRGFNVVHCANGADALAAITATEPGLAIVDLNMPGMNGLELIARLRQTPQGRSLPILAATALVEAEQAQRCRAAGADAHLPKPLSLTALAQRISSLTGIVL